MSSATAACCCSAAGPPTCWAGGGSSSWPWPCSPWSPCSAAWSAAPGCWSRPGSSRAWRPRSPPRPACHCSPLPSPRARCGTGRSASTPSSGPAVSRWDWSCPACSPRSAGGGRCWCPLRSRPWCWRPRSGSSLVASAPAGPAASSTCQVPSPSPAPCSCSSTRWYRPSRRAGHRPGRWARSPGSPCCSGCSSRPSGEAAIRWCRSAFSPRRGSGGRTSGP